MFLAAAPYFQRRFARDAWILSHFQAAEVSVSCVMNIGTMLVLTKLQKNASYPKRIALALVLYSVCFTLLSVSTLVQVAPGVYFGFLMAMVAATAGSTGLIQNGLFSFSSGFGRSEYTQAIMTGQAIAGVLPALAQIITVAAVPARDRPDPTNGNAVSPKSAFAYFLAATAVSALSLIAFFYLLRRQSLIRSKAEFAAATEAAKANSNDTSEDDVHTSPPLSPQRRTNHDIQHQQPETQPERPSIPITTFLRKLPLLSVSVFLCFGITMLGFPVFTASITSINNAIDPAIFIPLGFLVWNIGDLVGRLCSLSPAVSLTHYPFALFCLAMARLVFIPSYLLCNVGGRGALIKSDLFYLAVVQGLFGISNGYLGSQCMMGAGEWVAPEEREAAGGFMGLMLVLGLTVGSLLSFLLGGT